MQACLCRHETDRPQNRVVYRRYASPTTATCAWLSNDWTRWQPIFGGLQEHKEKKLALIRN